MKKIIAAFVAVVGLMIVSAPPAEANPISDAASSTWSTSKGVASDTVHVLGGVIEPVVDFIVESTDRVVMTAIDHPVQAGLGLAMVVATVAAPPLLSVDGEVLATAATVETAGSVELADAAAATVEAESVGSADSVAEAGAQSETTEVAGAVRTAGFEKSDVTTERCYVATKCGEEVAPVDRDQKRYLSTKEKEALKDRACLWLWCKSEKTGKIFMRKNAEIDHIVPHACGGNTSIENSQVISKKENLAKGGVCLAA